MAARDGGYLTQQGDLRRFSQSSTKLRESYYPAKRSYSSTRLFCIGLLLRSRQKKTCVNPTIFGGLEHHTARL